MGAHGWVAGIASHGSVSLSRGWLISVEAPRHPRHLSSIQLDAVVNMLLKALRKQKMDVFLSSALTCMGFSTGQPRIHQGNQIHGFGCPVFEIGTTWIVF